MTIGSNEDKHPHKNVVACSYSVACKELQGEFFKAMLAALASMSSQNGQQRFLSSIDNNLISPFMDVSRRKSV